MAQAKATRSPVHNITHIKGQFPINLNMLLHGVHIVLNDLLEMARHLVFTPGCPSWRPPTWKHNWFEGEQNVNVGSKHVRVRSETKCVRHIEHPVPMAYRWRVGKTFPCSATVQTATRQLLAGADARSDQSARIFTPAPWWEADAMRQAGETLTILAVWIRGGDGMGDKLEAVSHRNRPSGGLNPCCFHAGVSSTLGFGPWRIWKCTRLEQTGPHSSPR